MATNVDLFNAAFQGCIAGMVQSGITSSVAADYAPTVNAAVAVATRVDSKIALDAGLITPVDTYTLKRTMLMQSICTAVMAGRVPTNTTAAFYDVLASAIAALYTQAAASLA